MNRLALIAATGFLALILTGCGERDNSKPTPTVNDTVVEQPAVVPAPQQPVEENQEH